MTTDILNFTSKEEFFDSIKELFYSKLISGRLFDTDDISYDSDDNGFWAERELGSDSLLLFVYHIEAVTDRDELTERSSRKKQFDFAVKKLGESNSDMGIFVFYDSSLNFRMSYIYKIYKGRKAEVSNYKRFTHYGGKNYTNRTFAQQMQAKDRWQSSADILEAFSVEKVTKEFYTEILNWYNRAVKSCSFPFTLTAKKNKDTMQKEAVLRIITRLMFVWFMKQKNWCLILSLMRMK